MGVLGGAGWGCRLGVQAGARGAFMNGADMPNSCTTARLTCGRPLRALGHTEGTLGSRHPVEGHGGGWEGFCMGLCLGDHSQAQATPAQQACSSMRNILVTALSRTYFAQRVVPQVQLKQRLCARGAQLSSVRGHHTASTTCHGRMLHAGTSTGIHPPGRRVLWLVSLCPGVTGCVEPLSFDTVLLNRMMRGLACTE